MVPAAAHTRHLSPTLAPSRSSHGGASRDNRKPSVRARAERTWRAARRLQRSVALCLKLGPAAAWGSGRGRGDACLCNCAAWIRSDANLSPECSAASSLVMTKMPNVRGSVEFSATNDRPGGRLRFTSANRQRIVTDCLARVSAWFWWPILDNMRRRHAEDSDQSSHAIGLSRWAERARCFSQTVTSVVVVPD